MASHAIVENIAIASINVEQEIALPEGTTSVYLRLRNPAHSLKVAVKATLSATKYFVVDSTFPVLEVKNAQFFKQSLFVQSPDSAIIELFVIQK